MRNPIEYSHKITKMQLIAIDKNDIGKWICPKCKRIAWCGDKESTKWQEVFCVGDAVK